MVVCTGGAVIAAVWGAVVGVLGTEDTWWVALLVLGVVLGTLLLWCTASFMLEVARYADGDEAIGTIEEVRVDDSMGPESNPSYDMLIAVELEGGGRLRRAARESPREEPLVGQRVRFLHNTQDPDDLNDILLLDVFRDDKSGP
jgi:Na+/melibiose symporter-like transporter